MTAGLIWRSSMHRRSDRGDFILTEEIYPLSTCSHQYIFSRDLLRLGNYNARMRVSETEQLAQGTSTIMGRAVASQTDSDFLSVEEDRRQRCSVPGCFCKSSDGFNDWTWMTRGGLSLILVLIFFTFGCGLELDMQQYFPATWHLLR